MHRGSAPDVNQKSVAPARITIPKTLGGKQNLPNTGPFKRPVQEVDSPQRGDSLPPLLPQARDLLCLVISSKYIS